jgi:sugar/nucleoside kinase (ribokinase family)
VAGSIALDDLEGEFGRVQNELGGSALYFALAASLLHPVSLVAPVGRSEAETVRALLAPRPVDISGLSILQAPTYRWRARQEHGANLDLGSQDSIYDSWEPSLPSGFAGWAFVGSMRPDRQLQVARNLRAAAALLAADAMHSYVSSAPEQALAVVDLCDWYFANEAELRALGGDPAAPDGFRRRHGLAGLVVKSGAAGVAVHTASGGQRLGAPSVTVLDTTGAGDALAGGMLAGWCRSGGAEAGLELALVQGLAAAALAISAVGLRGLAAASPALLAERVRASRPQPAES